MQNRIVLQVDAKSGNIKKVLSGVEAQAEKTGKRVKKGLDKGFDFKSAIEGATGLRLAMAGVGLAVVGSIAGAIRSFSSFENEIRSVKTLLSDNSFASAGLTLNEGFKSLEKGAIETIKKLPVEISSVNKALFDTVSAGVDASNAIDVVGSAGRLAVAGLTDIGTATDGITTALNAFGIDAANAESVAAKFFSAQKAGKTTIEELSSSIGVVASTASSAGVGFEELLAAVSTATLSGVQTSAAFTGAKAAISNIIKPTADAAKEAAKLGVAFSAKGLKEAGGLNNFLNEIQSSANFNSESFNKLFGSTEALGFALAITGKNADTFNSILGDLNNNGLANQNFNAAFEAQISTLSNTFVLFGNNVKALAIQIGGAIAPAVSAVVSGLSNLVTGFSDLFLTVTGIISRISGDFSGLTGVISENSNEIISKLTAAAAGFAFFRSSFATNITNVVGKGFQASMAIFKTTLSTGFAGAKAVISTFGTAFSSLKTSAAVAFNGVKGVFTNFSATLSTVKTNATISFTGIVEGIKSIPKRTAASFAALVNNIKSVRLNLSTIKSTAVTAFKSLNIAAKSAAIGLKVARVAANLFKATLSFGISIAIDFLIGKLLEMKERFGGFSNTFQVFALGAETAFRRIQLKLAEFINSFADTRIGQLLGFDSGFIDTDAIQGSLDDAASRLEAFKQTAIASASETQGAVRDIANASVPSAVANIATPTLDAAGGSAGGEGGATKLTETQTQFNSLLQANSELLTTNREAFNGIITSALESTPGLRDELLPLLGAFTADPAQSIFSKLGEDIDSLKIKSEGIAGQFSKTFGQNGVKLLSGFGKAAGGAFSNFGKSLAQGEANVADFGKAMLGFFGTALTQFGTQLLASGFAMLLSPLTAAEAPGTILAGSLLATAGGVLSGLSGGKGGGGGGVASSGGAGSAGTPNVAAPVVALDEEPEERRSNIVVNFQETVSTEESRRSLAEMIFEINNSDGIDLNFGNT